MTTVAIHQPNLFPWVGYFDKIIKSDVFVFLDDVQFTSGTMLNRMYIDSGVGNLSRLTIPVHAPFPSKIKDVEISWCNVDKIWRTIAWTYHTFPFYAENESIIKRATFNKESNLSTYNINAILMLCAHTGLTPRRGFFRQSELGITSDKKSTQMLIDIILKCGCDTYYSGVGARVYMDEKLMRDNGISVVYQNIEKFPTTSIIDVLMKHGIEGVRKLIS